MQSLKNRLRGSFQEPESKSSSKQDVLQQHLELMTDFKSRSKRTTCFRVLCNLLLAIVIGTSLSMCFFSSDTIPFDGSINDGNLLHIRVLKVEIPTQKAHFIRIVYLEQKWSHLDDEQSKVEQHIAGKLNWEHMHIRYYEKQSRNSTIHKPTDLVKCDQIDRSPDDLLIPHEKELRIWPEHEFDPYCKPMAEWQSSSSPTCNTVHETDFLLRGISPFHPEINTTLLSSSGFWRLAWSYSENFPRSTTSVWKTFKIHHHFDEKYYEDNRVDAVAMERLSSSSYVMNIYSFCALMIVQEFAGKSFSKYAIDRKTNSSQKLELAIQVANGLADIHSVDPSGKIIRRQTDTTPTLVHNDINIANLALSNGDRPIFNDFNIAVLVMQNNITGQTCPFYSRFPNPLWKAPEEEIKIEGTFNKVDYKVDIYGLGNLLYFIAVGSRPWRVPHKLQPTEISFLKRHNGTFPPVPISVLHDSKSDNSLNVILEAMKLCYTQDPKQRPSAEEIANFLEQRSA